MADLGVLTTPILNAIRCTDVYLNLIKDFPLVYEYDPLSIQNMCNPITQSDEKGIYLNSGKVVRFSNYCIPLELPKLAVGTGMISGIVKVEGVLWSNKLVRLYRKVNGLLVGETATDINGYFVFYHIQFDVQTKYFVIASHEGFNAVVMDDIIPVVM